MEKYYITIQKRNTNICETKTETYTEYRKAEKAYNEYIKNPPFDSCMLMLETKDNDKHYYHLQRINFVNAF